jgi:hypothetical protein
LNIASPVTQGWVMKHTETPPAAEEVQAIFDLYQRAAQELLLAYQRNKEATRHHGSGAFRAALHHARMSCMHSAAAHEHLAQALERSMDLSSVPLVLNNTAACMAVRREH